MSEGKTWFMCSDELTIADFAFAGIAFSYWQNEHHSCERELTSISAKVIKEYKYVEAYQKRLFYELVPQLQKRTKSNF